MLRIKGSLDISDLDSGVKYGVIASGVDYMADVFYRGQDWDWNPNEDPPPEKEPDYIWPRELENQAKKSSQGVISSISDYFWPKPTTRAKYTIPSGPGWTISDEPPGKEHRDQAIDNLLILTQDPADLHLDENTIGNFQKLAEFREQVRKRLEDVLDSLGPSKLSSHILRVVYAGRMHHNWVIFRNLSPSAIAAAVASDELRSASALSLCVDNLKLEEDEGGLNDLAAALSQSTGLKQLCFFQGPDRDSDNASANFWTQLQQWWRLLGDVGWLRDRIIYLTCAFSSSLCSSQLSTPLPATISLTPPVVQAFPVIHMFTFINNIDYRFPKHQNSSSSSYYDDMSNTLLIPERFAVRFLSYLRSVGLGSDKAVLRFAYEEASSSLTTTTRTSTITDDDDKHSLPRFSFSGRFAVSPIPTGHFAPPPEINDQSRTRVRDIEPGSWVVLVDQRSRNPNDRDNSLLRYAFIRIGRTSANIVSEKQQHRSSPVLLKVVGGLTEFLRETVPGIGLSMWEKRVKEVEKDLRARASTEMEKRYMGIGVIDESSSLALLDQIL